MNTQPETAPEANKSRDEKGRFKVGNLGGPGNPFARQVAALRKALIDSVTPQDIQHVAAKLIDLAKDGNVQAAKLLLAYTIGKPQPAPEPDHLDADEWNVYREQVPMKEETAGIVSSCEPSLHLGCVRATRPLITALQRDKLIQMALEDPAERNKREAAEAAQAEANLASQMDMPEGFFMSGPSANGFDGEPTPSANGDDGGPRPSTNGKKRPTPKGSDRYEPSTNGDLPPNGRPCMPA